MGVTRTTPKGHSYDLFADSVPDPYNPVFKGRRRPGRTWGWDCLNCNCERVGFKSLHDADQDCLEFHEESAS